MTCWLRGMRSLETSERSPPLPGSASVTTSAGPRTSVDAAARPNWSNRFRSSLPCSLPSS
ncbi:Uncharacterised protein [Mycobacteroides abscessus subsp. abscessus]|nr:Uncharacterised protein [Mycobacteroides abscessus subsp. abscessus]